MDMDYHDALNWDYQRFKEVEKRKPINEIPDLKHDDVEEKSEHDSPNDEDYEWWTWNEIPYKGD